MWGLRLVSFSVRSALFHSPSASAPLRWRPVLAVPLRFHSSTPTAAEWDFSVRLHGTVTAFKHRRGYGFVLAEGYTKRSAELLEERRRAEGATDSNAVPATSDFFFTRGALGGGFYVTEGDRVSFRLKHLDTRAGGPKGTSTHHYVSRDLSGVVPPSEDVADAEEAGEPSDVPQRAGPGHHATAIGLRRYNPLTGEETRILPVSIAGVVTSWDAIHGTGVISELDVEGKLHADAPTFSVVLEDVDLSPVADASESVIGEGRYVKFCLEPTAEAAPSDPPRPRASRVIIDVGAERRNGVARPRRGGSSSRRRPTSTPLSDVLPDQRGVVRETVEQKYGFIVDDATGESIFFHGSEVVDGESMPRAGSSVVYDLRSLNMGRHAGKKHCLRVRLLADAPHDAASEMVEEHSTGTASLARTKNRRKSSKGAEKQENNTKTLLDEFDLLD